MFFQKHIEVYALFFRFLLNFFIYNVLKGALKLSEKLSGNFHATWYVCFVLILAEVSALVVGLLCLSNRFSGGVLVGSFLILGSLLKGYLEFLEGLLFNGERCPGN